jgi:hypothetical protein
MIKSVSHASALLLTLLVALPSLAYRREYVITWEGQRKPGSEVCFYRGERGDAFSLFFTGGEVRCLPADAILDFPPGLIHAFARHKDGYASMQRDYSVFDGPPNPERGYQKLETPLVKAGIVDFASMLKRLGAKQQVGIWVSSSPLTLGTYIPLVSGESTIYAPADITVVPIISENGLPVAVGQAIYLQPGERESAVFDSHPETSDLIVWTHTDTESISQARSMLQPPTIAVKTGDRTFNPLTPLYGVESGTLLIFRGLPRGAATLTSQGSMWKPFTRALNISAQPLIIEREPIPLISGGSVVVRWSTGEPHSAASDCPGAGTDDVPVVRAALRRCVIDSADGKNKCSDVASTSAQFGAFSSLAFDGVPAGSYTVLVESPDGKRQSLAADVVVGRASTVDVTFPSFNFFGTVKVDGKPVRARLIFDTGQAVSDNDGTYNAALVADPHNSPVHIEPCDAARTLTYIPQKAPTINAPFDMDLRLASVTVQVLDPQHRPVSAASVGYAPIRQVTPQGIDPYFRSTRKNTDDAGHVFFDDVPQGFAVSICARQPRYLQKCDTFDLPKLDGQPAVIQFDPVAMRGHVEGHTGQGYVTAVNPGGVAAEAVPLDPDGNFLFQRPHAAPEYLVYVSSARPLFVLSLPLIAPPDLTIQVPTAGVRTFTVSAPDLQAQFAFVGVWVGGRYVPLQTLNEHMEMRGLDSVLHRGNSVQIPAIAETEPITVALGVPDPTAKDFVDVFTLPQYAGVARHPVQTSSVVLSQ